MKYFLFFFFQCIIIGYSFGQEDSIPRHFNIKVRKVKDSVYIKTKTDFYVYYNTPSKELNYSDFVLRNLQTKNSKNSERIKIKPAHPKMDTTTAFDYASYFKKNKFIKEIKLHTEENDTVQLLINVDKNGKVCYIDLNRVKKLGDARVVYSNDNKEYKVDVVHETTKKAFEELLTENWNPAEILTLKKHPSKQKNKYTYSTGYMQGVLTIYYSSVDFDK